MATLLRFPTLRSLYDAFPAAADDIGLAASDGDCLALVQSLAMQKAWIQAVSLCAYLLPRREAVWWGCQSLRALQPEIPGPERQLLAAAEAWVRRPEEAERRAALAAGSDADGALPATWIALAAGWSGGSMVPPDLGFVRPPPEQTGRAVRAGLLMAMTRTSEKVWDQLMGPCIESGVTRILTGVRTQEPHGTRQ